MVGRDTVQGSYGGGELRNELVKDEGWQAISAWYGM